MAYIPDPIHGQIRISGESGPLVQRIVHTPEMIRLLDISQLGLVKFDEPSLTHYRYPHSLGCYAINVEINNFIRENYPQGYKYPRYRAHEAAVAALTHDTGHKPFSHVVENVAKLAGKTHRPHEQWSKEIITNEESHIYHAIRDFDHLGVNAYRVAKMVSDDFPEDIFAATVSSQFDSDRLDWMLRDQPTVRKFDWRKILELSQIEAVDSAKGGKRVAMVLYGDGIVEMKNYLVARYDAYKTLYQGSNKTAIEAQLRSVALRIGKVVEEVGSEKLHIFDDNAFIQFLKNGDDISFKTYMEMDDASVREVIKNAKKFGGEYDEKLAVYAKSLLEGPNRFVGVTIQDYLDLDDSNKDAVLGAVREWMTQNNLEEHYDYHIVASGKAGYKHVTDPEKENLKIMAFSQKKREICDLYDVSSEVRQLTHLYQLYTVVVPNQSYAEKLTDFLYELKNNTVFATNREKGQPFQKSLDLK